MLKEITDTLNPDVYNKLYNYISEAYDARPSTTKAIIASLPELIEKKIKEIEGGITITAGGQLSPIPEDFGPVPKTIDVLY